MNEDIISNQKFQSRFSNGDVINQSIEENGIANSYQILLKNTLWNLQLQKDLLVKVFKIVDNIEYKLFEGNLPEFLDYMNSDYSEQILVESLNENSRPITVELYEDENGCPVKEFLDQLKFEDLKLAGKTEYLIYKLENGLLGQKESEKLTDDIYELRVRQGSNITRVFYFFLIGNKAIITHGCRKKKGKVPEEIKRAEGYREKYLSNHNVNMEDKKS